jgi:hypothetical protein
VPPEVPERVIRRIAVDADADKRTVLKVLAGMPVRGVVRDRIVKACVVRRVRVPDAPKWQPPGREV